MGFTDWEGGGVGHPRGGEIKPADREARERGKVVSRWSAMGMGPSVGECRGCWDSVLASAEGVGSECWRVQTVLGLSVGECRGCWD